MSFRTRIALVSAGAVALAVILASGVVWLVVRDQLYREVDSSLSNRADAMASQAGGVHVDAGTGFLEVPGAILGEGGFIQVVQQNGRVLESVVQVHLPVTKQVLAVAHGEGGSFFMDATVNHTPGRVLTVPVRDRLGQPAALEISQPLEGVHHTLDRITLFLLLIAAGGVALGAGLGLVVSRAALGPVRRLTRVTETVTETGDLSERIEAQGADELGRLASSFNTMLAGLEVSTKAQRQLVADASHELRTPLTSMRTNIEVLARGRELSDEERARLLHDVVEQLGEMTTLIAGLIELARGDQRPAEPEDIRLDLLVADAVERAHRDRPTVQFETDLEESTVRGVPETLERAVSNLLDNAAKWSPPGGQVDVTVTSGRVVVRDRGPGIDEEHVPYVFDRFYRAPAARRMPGSGLGLAIVKQVAEAHGGTVTAERAPDGGTIMTLSLNGAAPS
jgi:two-component system, OmpR family, sensor histidine kinase MprB